MTLLSDIILQNGHPNDMENALYFQFDLYQVVSERINYWYEHTDVTIWRAGIPLYATL